MAKRFSPEFKQQAIDYALSNSHESVAAIAQKLGVGYSTLDKVKPRENWVWGDIFHTEIYEYKFSMEKGVYIEWLHKKDMNIT